MQRLVQCLDLELQSLARAMQCGVTMPQVHVPLDTYIQGCNNCGIVCGILTSIQRPNLHLRLAVNCGKGRAAECTAEMTTARDEIPSHGHRLMLPQRSA